MDEGIFVSKEFKGEGKSMVMGVKGFYYSLRNGARGDSDMRKVGYIIAYGNYALLCGADNSEG